MHTVNENGTYEQGLNGCLQFQLIEDGTDRVRMDMPVTPDCLQPFGYVHGGATLALLEAAGSRGAEMRCNLETHRPFGVHMDVKHVHNCNKGTVHALAEIASEEDLGNRGTMQVWHVCATDDNGTIMSEGTFATRIVPLAYLQQKEAANA